MSLPWYVTLCLFLLAPFYGTWIRDKVWPYLQDWWARTDVKRLRKRVQQLKSDVRTSEALLDTSDTDVLLRLQLLSFQGSFCLTAHAVLVALLFLLLDRAQEAVAVPLMFKVGVGTVGYAMLVNFQDMLQVWKEVKKFELMTRKGVKKLRERISKLEAQWEVMRKKYGLPDDLISESVSDQSFSPDPKG